jgi:hypothetical protein
MNLEVERGKQKNKQRGNDEMMEQMDNKLVEVLEENGFEFHGFNESDKIFYVINFYDDLGKKGLVVIEILEDEPKYQLHTSKASDEDIVRNEKEVKGLKAIVNYINRFVD